MFKKYDYLKKYLFFEGVLYNFSNWHKNENLNIINLLYNLVDIEILYKYYHPIFSKQDLNSAFNVKYVALVNVTYDLPYICIIKFESGNTNQVISIYVSSILNNIQLWKYFIL